MDYFVHLPQQMMNLIILLNSKVLLLILCVFVEKQHAALVHYSSMIQFLSIRNPHQVVKGKFPRLGAWEHQDQCQMFL